MSDEQAAALASAMVRLLSWRAARQQLREQQKNARRRKNAEKPEAAE